MTTSVKVCSRCGEPKILAAFVKRSASRDGRSSWCRECDADYRAGRKDIDRARRAKYYSDNREHLLAAQGKRHKENPGRARAAWSRSYVKHQDQRREFAREYSRGHPDRKAAHFAVRDAVRRGDIGRPDKCSGAGCCVSENIQAHHYDYNRPLNVVWLCASCHGRLHVAERLSDIAVAAYTEWESKQPYLLR